MALTENAQTLLGHLQPGGRAANAGRLRTELGWTEEDLDSAAQELCDAGLVEAKGRRLTRVAASGAVSLEAEMLLAALPSDGSSVGGLRLRSSLDLDNDTYTRVKRELETAGLITLGRGRGGTVARAEAKATERSPRSGRKLAAKESDLYEPFVDWLQADLAVQPGFAHAKITGTGKGWKQGTGKWSRPDVTAVEVTTHEWLPEVTLEVRSYEIKRFADATRLESVYEAAAHGRWAHRVSLVAELDPKGGPLPDVLMGEIRRFRLGLYVMRRGENERYDIREEIEPARTDDAQAEDVNDLINTFLGRDIELRNEYRRWIGR